MNSPLETSPESLHQPRTKNQSLKVPATNNVNRVSVTDDVNRRRFDPLGESSDGEEVLEEEEVRMDSIFRVLLHEQSLVQGDSSDPKLLSSLEYHKRDLMTALGTAKWQLEDFERAVNLSALSDKSHMRENAISQHQQFIRAIREQIIQVEKSLHDPLVGDSVRNSQFVNINEQDRDGLALFLSGGNPEDHHVLYDTEGTSIMKRFLDSTTASGFDNKSDEIVELKTEETKDSKLNGVMHLDYSFDSSTEHKLRKVVPHYPAGLGFEASVSLQGYSGNGNGESGSWDLENCDSNGKSFFSKNKLRGSNNKLDVLRFLDNYWSAFRSKTTKSFTKKWKDGEMGMDFDHRPSSSFIDMSQVEQVHHTQNGLASGFGGCHRLCFKVLRNTMQSCSLFSCKGRLQRLLYLTQVNRLPLWLISTILIMLIVLAILVSQVV